MCNLITQEKCTQVVVLHFFVRPIICLFCLYVRVRARATAQLIRSETSILFRFVVQTSRTVARFVSTHFTGSQLQLQLQQTTITTTTTTAIITSTEYR